MTGISLREDGSQAGFLWQNGVMTILPGLGGTNDGALGINARGQIVGQSQTADGDAHAVMWENGAIVDLGTLPGGSNSTAYSVNARGVACGAGDTGTGEFHAAVYADGGVVDLGTLGGTFSQCLLGANNRGQFVGSSSIAGNAESHVFVAVGGVMTDLNSQIPPGSGWVLDQAWGINERGQIVGGGTRHAMTRAFLLTR